jgi:UTP--glucose-1-phosphate uridylyltransferase
VHGVVLDGLRYDTGDKAECLRTVVRPACERSDLGREFATWLKEFVTGLEGRHDRPPRPGRLSGRQRPAAPGLTGRQ